MKWSFQYKKPENPQEQKQPDPQQSPYVGSNLDALQGRVAKIVFGEGIVHHQPTQEWAMNVQMTISRIQATKFLLMSHDAVSFISDCCF